MDTLESPAGHPWRDLIETVREAVSGARDGRGVQGSINWLRNEMSARGANPNVVRNIIYRDKGRIEDKRVLFSILQELWNQYRTEPFDAPEIEAILAPQDESEHRNLQALSHARRETVRGFVRSVRVGNAPKLLLAGKPGSGKSLLLDSIEEALIADPERQRNVLHLHLGPGDLGSSLLQFGLALGLQHDALSSRLAKIEESRSFALQAEAQIDFARYLADAAKRVAPSSVLLLQVSSRLAREDTLGGVPLRTSVEDVERTVALEWIWLHICEPLSQLDGLALAVSLADVPTAALPHPGRFAPPVRLSPPTAQDARRFVRARLPQLSVAEQETLLKQAGKSFEHLRLLSLLADLPEDESAAESAGESADKTIARVASSITHTTDAALRDFLAVLATLPLPSFPEFKIDDMLALLPEGHGSISTFERAFLADGGARSRGSVRCISQPLQEALARELSLTDPDRYRALHLKAAERWSERLAGQANEALAARTGEHLIRARAWKPLLEWMPERMLPPSLLQEIWMVGRSELPGQAPDLLEQLAERLTDHYVAIGAYLHPDAQEAFDILASSRETRRRAWGLIKQAEGSLLRGHHGRARALVSQADTKVDEVLKAEAALIEASIARWEGRLSEAAQIVEEDVRPILASADPNDVATRHGRANLAVWTGLALKDQGDLEASERMLADDPSFELLIRARMAFHQGDVRLSLGKVTGALDRFGDAITLSADHGALGSERTRYLARRGALYARIGELGRATRDVQEAQSALADASTDPIEAGFYEARTDDEWALVLLARGEAEEVMRVLAQNVERYASYAAAYGVNMSFRTDRTLLRLGMAYAARGLGVRWLHPLPFIPESTMHIRDVAHALALWRGVAERQRDRSTPGRDLLARRAGLLGALFAPLEEIDSWLGDVDTVPAIEWERAEVEVHLTALALRHGNLEDADAHRSRGEEALATLPENEVDPSLRLWLDVLTLGLAARRADDAGMTAALNRILDRPAAATLVQHALQRAGELLERLHPAAQDLKESILPVALQGEGRDAALRWGDRLGRRYAQQRQLIEAAD